MSINPKTEAKNKILELWEAKRLKSLAEIEFQREVMKPEMAGRIEGFKKEIGSLKDEISKLADSNKYEDRQKKKGLEEKLANIENNLKKQEQEIQKSDVIQENCKTQAFEAEKYLEIINRF